MTAKATIEFVAATAPIGERVTKFGGQPVWTEAPAWPLSRATGNPMRFICQIALDDGLFGATAGRMAYLFMTDEEDNWVDGTWEPDGGENAVIVQPGHNDGPTSSQATGPTLYRMVPTEGSNRLSAEPCEYAVELIPGVDELGADSDDDDDDDGLDENKLAGEPVFMQGEELPCGGPWRLLLQLDSCSVPFSINFGDAGVGYAFVDAGGARGKFLWQCA